MVSTGTAPSFEQQLERVYGHGFCPLGGEIIVAICDQWWRIVISCEHGRWRGESDGALDPGRAIERAITAATEGHP